MKLPATLMRFVRKLNFRGVLLSPAQRRTLEQTIMDRLKA